MKQNQAIQALVFLAIIILTSCTTPKGFSYESHARQGKTMKNRAMRRNDTGSHPLEVLSQEEEALGTFGFTSGICLMFAP